MSKGIREKQLTLPLMMGGVCGIARVGNQDLKIEAYAEMVIKKPPLSEQRTGFVFFIAIN